MGVVSAKDAHRSRKSSLRSNQLSNTSKETPGNTSPTSPTSPNTDKFKYIEGRRFHNLPDIHYDLPNDDDEGNI